MVKSFRFLIEVMTIDDAILPAVVHYLGGMIGLARAIHSEQRATGRSLREDLQSAKTQCLTHCQRMLEDPVPQEYCDGRTDYRLTLEDRIFLTSFQTGIEKVDWTVHEQIEGLMSELNRYAPHYDITGTYHSS